MTSDTLELLQDPVAQELLASNIPARLAYIWTDGTPRVIPIWFQWDGQHVVLGTPPTAPKLKALKQNPKVALTIDSIEPPYKVLMVRGTAFVKTVDGVASEYAEAADRYFGPVEGPKWVGQVGQMFDTMARIAIEPEWVGILDFEQRFPSAIANAAAN
jgi:hypothetical protein